MSLWRNRDFNIYWFGQALSVLGDGFAGIATPLLVLHATGSLRAMGALTACASGGAMLAGLLSGAIVDRVDRRRLMIGCDLARAGLWALVPLAFATGVRGLLLSLVFVVATVAAVAGNAFQVACITAVPNLAGRAQIVSANSRLHGTYAVMFLVGQALSGIVCRRWGPVVAIGMNAGSFVLSAASLMTIRIVRPPEPATADGPSDPAVAVAPEPRRAAGRVRGRLAELLAGARFLARQPALRAIAVLLAAGNLLQAARTDIVIYHLGHALHRRDDAVGATLALAGLGSLLAGALGPAMKHRFGYARMWLGCSVLQGLAVAALGLAPTLGTFGGMMVLLGFGDTARGIAAQSLRQEVTPDRLLGRVTSAFWTLISLPVPLGAALTTQLAAHTGTGPMLVSIGLACVGVAVVGLRLPVARE